MITLLLVFITLSARAADFVLLALVWRYFRRAEGRLVPPFRHVFGALLFLFAWVTISSILEAMAFLPGAGQLVERAAAFIVVPNLFVLVTLVGLYQALLRLPPSVESPVARKKEG